MHLEYQKENLTISTNPTKLDFDFIHKCLNESYWAKGIPLEVVKKSVTNSIPYGVYEKDKQIGFARLITDKATFAYLADVLITADYRGNGFSKWLMECIMKNPEIQDIRLFLLATQDAHTLYQKYGFMPVAEPKRFMEIFKPNIYQQKD
jgi:N-acetylglutamate synthase-like GNAT family acetyltransferase